MARKTSQIVDLIHEVNRRNKASTCDAAQRDGWNSLLEHILHEANVYAGFGYYTQEDVPTGCACGIIRDPNGENQFPDESRRFYYVSPKLTRK